MYICIYSVTLANTKSNTWQLNRGINRFLATVGFPSPFLGWGGGINRLGFESVTISPGCPWTPDLVILPCKSYYCRCPSLHFAYHWKFQHPNVVASFISTWQKLVSFWKRELWASLWYIYWWMIDMRGEDLALCGVTPGLVLLGAIRKQAKQAMRTQQESTPLQLLH